MPLKISTCTEDATLKSTIHSISRNGTVSIYFSRPMILTNRSASIVEESLQASVVKANGRQTYLQNLTVLSVSSTTIKAWVNFTKPETLSNLAVRLLWADNIDAWLLDYSVYRLLKVSISLEFPVSSQELQRFLPYSVAESFPEYGLLNNNFRPFKHILINQYSHQVDPADSCRIKHLSLFDSVSFCLWSLVVLDARKSGACS